MLHHKIKLVSAFVTVQFILLLIAVSLKFSNTATTLVIVDTIIAIISISCALMLYYDWDRERKAKLAESKANDEKNDLDFICNSIVWHIRSLRNKNMLRLTNIKYATGHYVEQREQYTEIDLGNGIRFNIIDGMDHGLREVRIQDIILYGNDIYRYPNLVLLMQCELDNVCEMINEMEKTSLANEKSEQEKISDVIDANIAARQKLTKTVNEMVEKGAN